MISSEVRSSVNLYVPIAIAGIVGYTTFKSKKVSWQVLIVIIVAAWLISWLMVRKTMGLITTASSKPSQAQINTSTDGTVPTTFDADRWATRLMNDIYSAPWVTRDHELYERLNQMNDAQLKMVYNSYRKLYFGKDNESMIQAMNGEVYGNNWFDNTASNAASIIKRLTNAGLT